MEMEVRCELGKDSMSRSRIKISELPGLGIFTPSQTGALGGYSREQSVVPAAQYF
jgi:hypothetical protein